MGIGKNLNELCNCGSNKKYKKCCLINLERKHRPLETMDVFLGKDWIKSQFKRVKLSGYKDLNPTNLAKTRLHPIISALIQINHKRQNKGEKYPLGACDRLIFFLHNNLTILQSKLDLKYTQKRLQSATEYPKVTYELAIAAGYRRLGYKVDFIPPNNFKRTGEFYVSDGTNKILIECKKKDYTSKEEAKKTAWWDLFQHLMTKKLKQMKKYFGVIINIPENVKQTEIKSLIGGILKLANEEQEGYFDLLDKKYGVTLKKFCDDETLILQKDFDNFGNGCMLGSGIFLYHPKDPLQIKHPISIRGRRDIAPEEKIKSVLATLKDAYHQVEDDKPNIIYIDLTVPSMLPDKLKELVEKLPPLIEGKLKKDFSKISAVILTNIDIAPYNEFAAICSPVKIILNPNSKIPIPLEFKILGDSKNGKSLFEDVLEASTF